MTTLPHGFRLLLVATALSLSACGGNDDELAPGPDAPGSTPPPETGPGPGAGAEDNTYDHPGISPDVWDLLERMQEQGPPEYQARVHACPKVRYQTVGRLLRSRGVDTDADGADSAGGMWRRSDQALGAANYAARARENPDLTTASASRMFDIYLAAAPEIIAAMPGLDACTVGGQPARMFNDFDQCTPDGVACVTGLPANGAQLELCNETVKRATTPQIGKTIAVAALMAAAHTCE